MIPENYRKQLEEKWMCVQLASPITGRKAVEYFMAGAEAAWEMREGEIAELRRLNSKLIIDRISDAEMIAEAVKAERERIENIAGTWTGCKHCTTGQTLTEILNSSPRSTE